MKASMEYKSNGCYTPLYKVLQLIGSTTDTSHYAEITDVYTGKRIAHVRAADDLKTAGALSEVLKFAKAEGGSLCIASIDAHTEGDKTTWKIAAYYPGTYGRYVVTREEPVGARAGAVLAYKWDKATRLYVWDTDVYMRDRGNI